MKASCTLAPDGAAEATLERSWRGTELNGTECKNHSTFEVSER